MIRRHNSELIKKGLVNDEELSNDLRLSVLAREFLKILWTKYQDAILLFENSLMICSGAIHALGKKTEGWQRRRSRRRASELN